MDVIFINSFKYASSSNGSTALLSLADFFRKKGHSIYGIPVLSGVPGQQTLLHPFYQDFYHADEWSSFYEEHLPFLDQLGFKLWSKAGRGSKEQIVIYPEVFLTNVFPDSHTVWYFGHRPGVLKGGHQPPIDKDTFVLAHSKILCDSPTAFLFYPLQDSTFSDVREVTSPSNRTSSATYTGKGHLFGNVGRIASTELITRSIPASKSELKDMLLRSRFVFSFDSWTNLIVEAILCGAIPVILRFDPFTKAEIQKSELAPIPTLDFHDVELRDEQWSLRDSRIEAWFELERLRFLARLARQIEGYESSLECAYQSIMNHFKLV